MPKIIFLSMIKNESRIIKRCIESVLPIADAICICDTGSTDNTVTLLTEYLASLKIPGKVYTEGHEWKNFGHNRSLSFKSAQDYCATLGWNPVDTYALVLDADMELKLSSFSKEVLKTPGYKIMQKAGSLEYFNTRFLQISHPWKCTGVTHEYWDGYSTDTLSQDKLYISDIGDGGCKSDKFERDVRLLEEGLREDPKNARYMFYLAQSYKDGRMLDKSIEMYKKRVEAGGWFEEIWYSMYMIMKLYGDKNNSTEVEYWGQRAYDYRKERSENLLYLTRWFRDRRQYYKAWHYWQLGSVIKKPSDVLFIETDVYEKQFDYERAIIHDYVFPEKKADSLKHSLTFFNTWGEQFAYNNILWFVQKVPSTIKPLLFQPIGDFVPTSTSMCRLNGLIHLNVRYVNYRIQHDGSYLMSEHGKLSPNNAVKTDNYSCIMDNDYSIISPLQKMNNPDPPTNPARIRGLEDVRIFNQNGTLQYIATTSEYSYDGCIRQHMGVYNTRTYMFEESCSLEPPIPTNCEKNWIPYKNKIIYKWHPFEIGTVTDNKLVITSRQQTPNFLSHMRGSSTLVEKDGFMWGITHCVIYNTPRKYYHMVVKIDTVTDKLVGYTDPFYFVSNAIEYCLGFDMKGSDYLAIISQNDANPIMVEFKNSDVHWNLL
jgi:glycosyltransferase involved in cell wall biosynthesis